MSLTVLAVWHLQRQPLEKINFYGEYSNIDADALDTLVRKWQKNSWVDLDSQQLTSDLMQLSWVVDATVDKPRIGVVDVTIQEHVPVFRRYANHIITEDGSIFTVGVRTWQKYQHLPTIQISTTNLSLVPIIVDALASLPDEEKVSVVALKVSAWLTIEIVFSHLSVVSDYHNLKFRLKRFFNWKKQQKEKFILNIESVDLRYNSGVSIKK